MITVAIATYNGAETLPLTLESMQNLKIPEGGWKLIVIDNASTDKTEKILKKFSNRLPLQVLYQPKRGKNSSLNMAIPYFEGELIVFTDDDVVPMPNWLIAFNELAEKHPEVSVFGGRIIPHWPAKIPDAIVQSIPLGPAFAVHPDGLRDGPVIPDMIWGANMAVRKHIFDAEYRFNEAIGPNIGTYVMGSETEFTHRLYIDGYINWFSNDICVKHQIMDFQLTPKWIFKRATTAAKGQLAKNAHRGTEGEEVVRILGLSRWRLWMLFKDMLVFPWSKITRNHVQYFKLIWRISENLFHLRNEITQVLKKNVFMFIFKL
jgi:glycosyltransferase involved in cell wall biosynthesis